MKIDAETIDRVATLARLSFDEKAKEKIMEDMNKILAMCEKLNELDTENVEPLIHLSQETNGFRKDMPRQEITKEDALRNAPGKNSDYYKVPKFLERE